MKFSIITVVKNGMPYLKDSIKSFELQNYKKKELIIIYSKSEDNTEKYLKSLKKKFKIYKDNNSGNRYDSINLGITKSSGDIIGILHADDIFFNVDILSKINKKFKKLEADGLYGGVYFSHRNNLKKIVRIWSPKKYNKNYLNYGWTFPHVSLFLKKEIFKKVGFYSDKYKISSDYDFALRLLLSKNIIIKSSNLYHTIMRIGGDSTKINKFFLKLKEDFIISQKFKLNIMTVVYKILFKINQLFKKKMINNIYINKFI